MNRRRFLSRLAQGAAAVVIASHVPLEWLPEGAGRFCALQYLRDEYNRVSKGFRPPEYMRVSPWMFELAQSELLPIQRFCSTAHMGEPSLVFKSAVLRPSDQISGKQITFYWREKGE